MVLPLFPLMELHHRMSIIGKYQGIRIADVNLDDTDDESFLEMTIEALKLIEEHDPHRFRRVRRHVKWIVNSELLALGRYQRIFRVCYMDFLNYGAGENTPRDTVRFASTVVHEATHGHVFSRHIAYTRRLRIRIERLCRLEQKRFVGHLEGDWLVELKDELKFDPQPWIDSWQQKIWNRFKDLFKRIQLSRMVELETKATSAFEAEDYQQALEHYEQACELREKIYGDDDSDVWVGRLYKANILAELGRTDEAESIYNKALQFLTEKLGEGHKDSLMAKQSLAVHLYDQDRFEESERLHREVIQTREQSIGAEHISTLTTKYSLAVLLDTIDRREEAMQLCQNIVNVAEKQQLKESSVYSQAQERLEQLKEEKDG